jgi:hypothetical protein
LARLQRSYRYAYEGTERLGMMDGFDWEAFSRFAREHLHLIWTYPPQADAASFPWERWPEFLKQADAGVRLRSFIAIYELR